jgi:ankyrin repeat protein
MYYVNTLNELKLNKALIKACLNGDVKNARNCIKQVLHFHHDIDFALYISAQKELSEIVKSLIERGADINVRNGAVLKFYIARNDLEMVEWLIDHRADIYTDSICMLHICIKQGNLNILKCLVKNGINVHTNRCVIYRIANEHGHSNILEYLGELEEKEWYNNKIYISKG